MHLKPVHLLGGVAAIAGVAYLATRKSSPGAAPGAPAPTGPGPGPTVQPASYEPPHPLDPLYVKPASAGDRVQLRDTVLVDARDPGLSGLLSLFPAGVKQVYGTVTRITRSGIELTVNAYRFPDADGGAANIQDAPATVQPQSVLFIDREGNMPV